MRQIVNQEMIMWQPIVKLLIAAATYYVAWHITKKVDADYAPISILSRIKKIKPL